MESTPQRLKVWWQGQCASAVVQRVVVIPYQLRSKTVETSTFISWCPCPYVIRDTASQTWVSMFLSQGLFFSCFFSMPCSHCFRTDDLTGLDGSKYMVTVKLTRAIGAYGVGVIRGCMFITPRGFTLWYSPQIFNLLFISHPTKSLIILSIAPFSLT